MLGNIVKLFFWRYLRSIVAKLPVRIIDGLTLTLNTLKVSSSPKKMKIMAEELARSGLTDSDKFPWKLVYSSFLNQSNRWVKKCLLSKIHHTNVERFLDVDGLSHLSSALSHGNGAILLNPHFGPFLFALPALGYRNFPVNQVAMMSDKDIFGTRKGLKKRVYDSKFQAIEAKIPATFINAADNPMVIRTVLKKLKKNQIVFFSSTGRDGRAWKKVDFLNRKASFTLAPFRLAIKTGVPILPVFALNSQPVARIVIEKALEIQNNTTAEDLLAQYTTLLADYVRKYPSHFGYFLYEMHIKSWKDDHPFFDDYTAGHTH